MNKGGKSFQSRITYSSHSTFTRRIPHKVRPRSRFTSTAQVDEQTRTFRLFPPRHNDFGAQVQRLHVDLEHQVELLLRDLVRRRCVVDHTCAIHHDVETVVEEAARRGENLTPR